MSFLLNSLSWVEELAWWQLPSAWALLITNLVSAVVGVANGWGLKEFMLLYWCQSVIIGFFQFLKILDLKEFFTEGFLINGRPVSPTPATKRWTAYFFAFHYGFFHLVYLAFMGFMAVFGGLAKKVGWLTVLSLVGMFFLNHLFSYLTNRKKDRRRKPNIGSMMFFPYIRIVPMHFTILFAFPFVVEGEQEKVLPLLFFLILKTGGDVVMHLIEHRKR